MKTLQVFGWAFIFTVTLLLAACASHATGVADTDAMSGPDLTMTQNESQQQMIERRENALEIRDAWLDERELQLIQREFDVERQENALAINQSWFKEHEMRLAQSMEGLTTSSIKLAGTDSTPVDTSPALTKVEAGRCYASVVFPAEYKTVAVIKPVSQPSGDNQPVVYQSVIEKVKVTDEQIRWEEILCEDRMTECRISEVQRALYRGGYNPGPINGIVGPKTMAAVNAFQKDFNLSVANHLTIETVKALDANF